MSYEIKRVIGGQDGVPDYDEVHFARAGSNSEATIAAFELSAHGYTVDILKDGYRIARVHIDGGVDYYR